MTTSVKRKKLTATMGQMLLALFRIDAGESLIKIARELGVGKQPKPRFTDVLNIIPFF